MKYLFILIFQFANIALFAQAKLQLVTNGKSNYSIVIPAAETETEKQAAQVMQEYISRVSGALLPVINDAIKPKSKEIIIGNTNRYKEKNNLEEDGYHISTVNGKLIVTGGFGKGVMNGVVSFLEDYLGCRKFSPDAEYVPSNKTIAVGTINDKQVPYNIIRVINGKFPYDSSYKNWRKLHTIADKWNDGEWRGYYVHTFNRLVPSSEYFQSHPEYFSLVNGKRIHYGQLCLSNPAVFEIAVKQLKEDILAHPNIKYWSVSQNDNYDYCQCSECKKNDDVDGGPTGSVIQFVNKVAALFPDKIITTLAYQYTRKAPLHTKPAKNVMITLCTIELNRSLPIEQDSTSASFVSDIKAWSKISSNIMLWDYEIQFTNYLCPFPLFHTLQPNIQFFNKYGVRAQFQQCNITKGAEFAELKAYLLSKLLWSPNADANAIIDDFMKGYYKQAAPFLKSYFTLLHCEAAKSKQRLDIYGSPVWNAKTFLSPELIARYYQLFDKAEAAVKDDAVLLQHVKIARLPVQYADMEIAKTQMFAENGWYKIENGKYILKPERKQLLEDFYAVCKQNNIVELNEHGLTADIFYHSTLRFIDVQVEGNLAFQKKVTGSVAPAEQYTGTGFSMLTNGVKGTDDYKINWLGWEGKDIVLTLDLEKETDIKQIIISALQSTKSWIVFPAKIECLISSDGINFTLCGEQAIDSNYQVPQEIKDFVFDPNNKTARFIRFNVAGTKELPAWHNYHGNKSWVFIDEIIVR